MEEDKTIININFIEKEIRSGIQNVCQKMNQCISIHVTIQDSPAISVNTIKEISVITLDDLYKKTKCIQDRVYFYFFSKHKMITFIISNFDYLKDKEEKIIIQFLKNKKLAKVNSKTIEGLEITTKTISDNNLYCKYITVNH